MPFADDLPEERKPCSPCWNRPPSPPFAPSSASSEELLEAFRPGGFELLLMDIYMDGMTGVEAVRKIREMDETIPIAFTTTSTEHTLESYRLSVLKYLEKPVRQKDINDLLHLVKLQRDSAPRLAIRQNGETQKIPLSELFYLEQKAHHVFLYRRDGGTLQLYGKLSEPAAPAGGAALFSAPTKATASIWPLSGGSTRNISATRWRMKKNVPISRSNRSKAKRAYEDFLFARTRGDG